MASLYPTKLLSPVGSGYASESVIFGDKTITLNSAQNKDWKLVDHSFKI